MQIVQLRSSIFISQTIGYTPEVASEFKKLLDLDGQIHSLAPSGNFVQGIAQDEPQWGMPWCIYKQRGNDTVYVINFFPNKIDFIVNKEADIESNTESIFLCNTKQWVEKILGYIGGSVMRVAYAPLYAILDDNSVLDEVKAKVFPLKIFAGLKPQDVGVSFNYKYIVDLSDKPLQTNLLCNISDGYRQNRNEKTLQNALMIQLDMNTIPSKNYELTAQEVSSFFDKVVDLKKQLLSTIL